MPRRDAAPLLLTARFDAALLHAHRLHAGQLRKGGHTPYVAHLLGVAALVLEDGGDEDEAIAALLHDAAEDHGGRATLDDLRARFGPRVAEIVAGCTDSCDDPKPPWRQRKEQHLARLRQAPPDVLRVAAADKLHNARAVLADLRRDGAATWAKFSGGREGTLWYYRALADLFAAAAPGFLADELERVVAEIERLAA